MADIWRLGNLAVAFVMELLALAALGWWGWRTGSNTGLRLLLAIGVPLLAAVAWGLFAAPNASHGNAVAALLTKVVVFGGAALALWFIHHRPLALAFVVVVLANLAFIKLGHLELTADGR